MERKEIGFNFSTHAQRDFTGLYKTLLNHYGNNGNCPALLLFKDVEPMIIEGCPGHYAVLLNRDSESIQKDLDELLVKKQIVVMSNSHALDVFWCQECDYAIWYRLFLEISEYLKVELPALFITRTDSDICDAYSSGITHFSGNAATDIVIRLEDRLTTSMTILHEMRHVWQKKYCVYQEQPDLSLEQCTILEYLMKEDEVDADAFVYWIFKENRMTLSTDSIPTYELRRAIRRRRKELGRKVKPMIISWFRNFILTGCVA